MVNAGITGVESLTLEQLAKGADVLFILLQLPPGSSLSSGIYIVRFYQNPGTTRWLAQFKNLDGKQLLETVAEVGNGNPALRKIKLTISLECDPSECTLTVDIIWIRGRAGTTINIGITG